MKLGILGAGGIASTMAKTVAEMKGVEVYAVAARDLERALAPSREKAKAFIMAGDVYVDGQKEDKAGTMFPETVKIEVRGNTLPYVSRGGLKLEKAMKNFDVTLDSKICMPSRSSGTT